MTSINGNAQCDKCDKMLVTQKERIDVYKRRLGSMKIYRHYCVDCFNQMEAKNDKKID